MVCRTVIYYALSQEIRGMRMEINSDWKYFLKTELKEPYFEELIQIIKKEYEQKTIYPKQSLLFNALNKTPFEQTKVIILGQDPYHGKDQANGLSFSVNEHIPIPPSLKNIFKELTTDLNCSFPADGDLTHWADEGVLLLNAILTVEEGKPNSHKHLGWQRFTDKIISILNEEKEHLVFILWGKEALEKGKSINQNKHLIIHSPHPSPLSAYRGFFNSRPFSLTNDYLIRHHIKPIQWVK